MNSSSSILPGSSLKTLLSNLDILEELRIDSIIYTERREKGQVVSLQLLIQYLPKEKKKQIGVPKPGDK